MSASKDWANPGKQSNGVNNLGNPGSQSGLSSAIGFQFLDVPGGAQAEFTGNYWDGGADADGNGLYDFLTFETEVSVAAAGHYSLTLLSGLI